MKIETKKIYLNKIIQIIIIIRWTVVVIDFNDNNQIFL